jgi:hypothetical protein
MPQLDAESDKPLVLRYITQAEFNATFGNVSATAQWNSTYGKRIDVKQGSSVGTTIAISTWLSFLLRGAMVDAVV